MAVTESEFRRELAEVLSRASRENGSNTPDFILAAFLGDCLAVFDSAVRARESWYGRDAEDDIKYTPQPTGEPS